MTVELLSLSPQTSRNSSLPKATPTSLSAVTLAVKLEKLKEAVVMLATQIARCTLLFVLSAAKIPRYLLNRATEDRSIVAIATPKTGIAVKDHKKVEK